MIEEYYENSLPCPTPVVRRTARSVKRHTLFRESSSRATNQPAEGVRELYLPYPLS